MEVLFKHCAYCAAIVVLVAFGSFFLGGFAVRSYYDTVAADREEALSLIPLDPEVSVSGSGRVYASSRGSRYYPWWCDKGKSISEANKVWFSTPQEAETEGYTIAKGCQ